MNDSKPPDASTDRPGNPGSSDATGDLSRKDMDTTDKLNGRTGGGDSGGGAYPNPHSGKEGGGNDGFMGHGGQTEMPYHGTGRLGEQDVGGNANSGAEKTRPGEQNDHDGEA